MEPLLEGNADVEGIWLNVLSLWECEVGLGYATKGHVKTESFRVGELLKLLILLLLCVCVCWKLKMWKVRPGRTGVMISTVNNETTEVDERIQSQKMAVDEVVNTTSAYKS